MLLRLWISALVGALCITPLLLAQVPQALELPGPPVAEPGFAAVADTPDSADETPDAPASAGEPTMPEVLVQPPERPPAEPPAEPSPPPQPPSQAPGNAYDLPVSYPSLSQLEFGGLSSGLRSTRSVFDTPRAVSIVDPIQLAERQARTMVEALEREVGVLMQRTGAGQASPFVRGLTGPQTLILIDGIRLNNSTFRFGPNQYFATIDPGMIERVEVVRGPQSVLWGSDAIGGVINVVTRSADTRLCNYAFGEFAERFSTADSGSYSRANVEGSLGRFGVFGGASYLNVNNLHRGGDLGTQEFTDYSQYAGDVKVDYLLDCHQMLTVALQHHEQMDVPRTDKWPREFRRFDPQQRDLGYVRWQGTDLCGPLDAFMLTVSFQQQKEGSIRRKPPTSLREDVGEFIVGSTGANLVLVSDLGIAGKLTYGVDWYHDDVDAETTRFDFGVDPPTATPQVPQFPDDAWYERFGVFLEWDVELTRRLFAVTGVRYSNIETGATVALFDPQDPTQPPVDTPINPNFQDWTASVGLTYELNPGLHLVGSVAEGFRAPTLDELTSVSTNVNEGIDIPNPSLKPEQSINYELGLKFDYERFRVQTFYFWTNLDGLLARQRVATIPDPLDPTDTIDVLQRRNVAQAELNGYELGAEVLVTPRWSVYGNLTYLLGQNLTDNEPLSRIPPTQGLIGLRWRDQKHRSFFDLYAWLVADQDRLSARDVRDSRIPPGGTPGYGTLNLRFGKTLGRHHRFTLGIENLTNEAYRVHGSGVDGPGISGLFGYELRR